MHFSNCYFCTGLWGKWVCVPVLNRNISVPYSPLSLLSCISEPCLFSELGILGVHLPIEPPKGWADWCWVWSLDPQEDLDLWDPSWLSVATLGVVFWVRLCLCVSYLLWCGPFTTCCERAVQLLFRSFSERIVPYVVADLMCSWEEMSSGSSNTAVLDNALALF